MTIVLMGQLRGGKNSIKVLPSGIRYPTRVFKEWRDNAVAQIIAQGCAKKRLDGPLHATIRYFKGDLRKRDLPALLDGIFHVLERSQVVRNDGLIESAVWISCGLDRKEPKAIITLEATP